jgi:asparagine synthase (glutamine-hydrolysing)
MCGIAAAAGAVDLSPALAALAHRGPDGSGMTMAAGVSLAHVRLAVQDPHPRSAQPYQDGPVTVSYNGELFNAPRLRTLTEAADPGRAWVTTGDTEVLAAALAVIGPGVLAEVDGMFAVAWADERTPGVLYLARDRYGEVPLHLHRTGIAVSELKALRALGLRCGPDVLDVPPGACWQVRAGGGVTARTWHQVGAEPLTGATLENSPGLLAAALAEAVRRRRIADVPVCSLLSGGIDSAVIACELARYYPDLVCYTAVLDRRSRDLRCARETAGMLGLKLVEVPVSPPTADDLARVVAQVELPFKAQVEIGWPCLALAGAMSADGFKVTYSGEGSDELWASYGFARHGIAVKGWHAYRRDLIGAQARRNFPRVNKAFMASGVEARLPFLDPDVVSLALSLPQAAVWTSDSPAGRKAVLQRAYAGRLPAPVLSRPKVAFQDGLGLKSAVAAVLPDPGRFYRAEYARCYG